MEKHLHIICLDVPYPVDYGGVFDLFYKLPALQQQGVKIHLHCFEYGRSEQPELNQYCASVNYYKRAKVVPARVPYIVASRKNEDLFSNLLKNDYPIMMEGIHCTSLLTDKRFASRKCFVRLHNVEHIYYRYLFKTASAILPKLYYGWESRLLYKYEKAIAGKATFLTVSKQDAEEYKRLGAKQIEFLPLFLPPWKVSSKEGKGTFCLYHGHLAVAENEKAAIWLLKNVFDDTEVPFIIAGKNPSKKLQSAVAAKGNVTLIANPSEEKMQELIANAHIHIIPSFNATGIKLKLVNALYNGRHCVVNNATVEGTGLESLCSIASDASSFKKVISYLKDQPITDYNKLTRSQLLETMFNNDNNARKLVKTIWG